MAFTPLMRCCPTRRAARPPRALRRFRTGGGAVRTDDPASFTADDLVCLLGRALPLGTWILRTCHARSGFEIRAHLAASLSANCARRPCDMSC
eukprot:scaffold135451_cov32-Tisochrysis_lutea.AAC.4